MSFQPTILGIGTAVPNNRYAQEEIYEVGARQSEFYRNDRIRQIFLQSDIEYRHFYFDLLNSDLRESLDELHDRFRTGAMEIGAKAIKDCLKNAKANLQDIDFIVAVSCTGYLCPGLTSLYIKDLGLRTDIQRADLLGMGCAGAMPGLQRAYDFVKAYPDKKALVITVEICSACYYIDDSLETVVGNAICADGAAAVLVGAPTESHQPQIIGFKTLLDPAYIDTVGFEQKEGRLRIVLSKDIRTIAGGLAKKIFGTLLGEYRIDASAVQHWIIHSGGRKVIDSIKAEMGFSEEQLVHSRCVLRCFGNMSSPTVLFVLKETIEKGKPKSGDKGVMLAMGPGLALEGALLQW